MPSNDRSSRVLIAAFFAVCVWNAHSPVAVATCGDYLHTRHSRPSEQIPGDHGLIDHGHAEESLPAEPLLPCSGPDCDRNDQPASSPFAPASIRISPNTDGTVACQQKLDAGSAKHPRCLLSRAFAKPGHPTHLDRPPQISFR